MKFSIYIIFLLFIGTVSCTTGENKTSDTYYKKAILGSWDVHIKEDDVEINAIDTYTEDGKIYQIGEVKMPAGYIYIEMESNWKIKNGVLISTITSLNIDRPHLIGSITKDTIISTDENIISFRDEEGKIFDIKRKETKANKSLNSTVIQSGLVYLSRAAS